MPTTDIEAPFVVSHNFCAIRANNVDDLLDRLREFNANDDLSEEISAFRSNVSNGQSHAAAVQTVKQGLNAEVIAETATTAAAAAEPEVIMGKYGDKFTYGLVDAPDLPDGRQGKYIFREWTDKAGKARRAFVDPMKGPKPTTPADAEAKIIWK